MAKVTSALLTAIAIVFSAAALQADELYVPLTNYPGDGTTLELVVTNLDATSVRSFAGVILAEGSNGKIDPGTPTETVSIDPGATRVIRAPPGTGLWRINGHDNLRLSARMRVPTGVTNHQGVEVPILSAENVQVANSTAVVQSLLAAHGYLTDFGLFNAGVVGARCEATVNLANGTRIGTPFVLLVPPLSFTLFENVAAIAVVPDLVSQVRISMSCDQPFSAFSRTVNPSTGYLALHTPATTIADGLPNAFQPTPTPPPPTPPPPPNSGPQPTPPNSGPPGNPKPATQAASFQRNGKFYTVTNGQPALVMDMPVPSNVIYSEFRVSYDFHHDGWNRGQPDGIHNTGYITRGGWSGDVFMLFTTRGPSKNLARLEITVDLPKNVISQKAQSSPISANNDYHVDYTYNHKARKWNLVVTEIGGGQVLNMTGPTTGPVWTKGGTWKIFFSDNTTAAHVTSLGWEFSNLLAEWVP